MAYPTSGVSMVDSTINKWMSGYTDQLFKPNVFITMCKRAAKTQKGLPPAMRAYRELSGGDHIQDTALIRSYASTVWTNSSDPNPVTEQEVLLKVQWPWTLGRQSAMISDFDDMRNNGPEAMVDAWQARLYAAGEQLSRDLEERFCSSTGYLTGVSSEIGPNSLEGLIAEAPTADTVGGISRATYSAWRNYYVTSCGAFATYIAKLNTAYWTCKTRDPKKIGWDFLLAGLTTMAAIEGYIQGKGQVQFIAKDDPDFGFGMIHYKGAPIVPSPDCNTSSLYGLNSHSWVYAVNTRYNMKVTSVEAGPDVDAKIKKIQHGCQLFPRSMREQAVMADWS